MANPANKTGFDYPTLTADVASRFSQDTGSRGPGPRAGGATGGGQTALVHRTIGSVLGWKPRTGDASGFAKALELSFKSERVEGVTQLTWTPRSYTVQSDLGGAVTGAQASLLQRAQQSLEPALRLLDGLEPLTMETDGEDIDALKSIVRKQLNELVDEFAHEGGPRLERVDLYLDLLLGEAPDDGPRSSDPDEVTGMIGKLRDLMGLSYAEGRVNTVKDEQTLTDYRLLCDHATSLDRCWQDNRSAFDRGPAGNPFLGTELVHLARQFTVIGESVEELRFVLESVFVQGNELQTTLLTFKGGKYQSIYAADFIDWIARSYGEEMVAQIHEGGKLAITDVVLPVAERHVAMLAALEQAGLPPGFTQPRVARALASLQSQLDALVKAASRLDFRLVSEPPHQALQDVVAQVGLGQLLAMPPLLRFSAGSNCLDLTLVHLLAVTEAEVTVTLAYDPMKVDKIESERASMVPAAASAAARGFKAFALKFTGSTTLRVHATKKAEDAHVTVHGRPGETDCAVVIG